MITHVPRVCFCTADLTVTVTGRMKELYSLWSKMVRYDCKLDGIQDVVALRVVLDLQQSPDETSEEWKKRGVSMCYHVLGLVQHLPGCQPVPASVKVP